MIASLNDLSEVIINNHFLILFNHFVEQKVLPVVFPLNKL